MTTVKTGSFNANFRNNGTLIFVINLTFSKTIDVRSFTFLQSRKGLVTFENNNNNYMLKT